MRLKHEFFALFSLSLSLTNPGGYGGACWICPLRVMLMNSLISQVISVAWWVCARYSVSHRWKFCKRGVVIQYTCEYNIQWMAALVQLHNAMHSGRQASSCLGYIALLHKQL